MYTYTCMCIFMCKYLLVYGSALKSYHLTTTFLKKLVFRLIFFKKRFFILTTKLPILTSSIDIDDFLNASGYKTKTSVFRILKELCQKDILARTKYRCIYWVNNGLVDKPL